MNNSRPERRWPMTRLTTCLLSAAFFLACVSQPIAAKKSPKSLDGRPVNIEGQPVTIRSCSANEEDSDAGVNAVENSTVNLVGAAKATKVAKVQFDFYDAADGFVGTRSGIADSTISPNATASLTFPGEGFNYTAVSYILCFVTYVKFADDTIWTRPANTPSQGNQ